MADLTITPANVVSRGGTKASGLAGVAINAGQMAYLDPADNRYKLADSDNASAVIRKAGGIALNGAAAGQPITVQSGGEVSLGAVLTLGATYYLSDTPGGIMPAGDLETGDFPQIVGIAASTSVLKLSLLDAGVALG
ncbi:MAG: hypothetical protein ACRDBL_11360 [Rhabdaerophilum sp.]